MHKTQLPFGSTYFLTGTHRLLVTKKRGDSQLSLVQTNAKVSHTLLSQYLYFGTDT
jgi:hypothetical protein